MSTRALRHVGLVALAAFFTVPAGADAAGETFGRDIAPILNRSCVGCHRPGEAAPMSLIGYENVRPWVRSIRQKVAARQMPPWSADSHRSVKFRNDPTLSQAEIDAREVVDAGAPLG
jgi:mono/diheme cytochrome c family protein